MWLFIVGCSKRLFSERLQTISGTIIETGEAVQTVDGDMLQTVYKNMETRFNFVIRGRGEPFEHLMN